jgi:hypothetical protein
VAESVIVMEFPCCADVQRDELRERQSADVFSPYRAKTDRGLAISVLLWRSSQELGNVAKNLHGTGLTNVVKCDDSRGQGVCDVDARIQRLFNSLVWFGPQRRVK